MGPWSEKRKTIEMALGMVFDGLPPGSSLLFTARPCA